MTRQTTGKSNIALAVYPEGAYDLTVALIIIRQIQCE